MTRYTANVCLLPFTQSDTSRPRIYALSCFAPALPRLVLYRSIMGKLDKRLIAIAVTYSATGRWGDLDESGDMWTLAVL
ncbi:hypothetical protein ANO14919_127050 [Xylariales sp. No.14919]|nr:hypothetical protein ANO14919_127050 [Xylariales sp. No.14919]